MAKDMKGNFHRAGFQARKADRMPPAEEKPMGAEAQPEPAQSGDHMHMAAESMHAAEPGSKHMIMSHDGYGLKTHSIDEQGQHEGPHEDEEAHAHMKRFMGEQEGKPMHANGEEPEENQSLY